MTGTSLCSTDWRYCWYLLPTVLGFLQEYLGFEALSLEQWLLCSGLAVALLLVDEVIKFFLRSRHKEANV